MTDFLIDRVSPNDSVFFGRSVLLIFFFRLGLPQFRRISASIPPQSSSPSKCLISASILPQSENRVIFATVANFLHPRLNFATIIRSNPSKSVSNSATNYLSNRTNAP